MNFLLLLVMTLSLLSILYYGIIIIYAGFGTSFSLFWLIVGVIGFGVSDGIFFMIEHDITLIPAFRMLVLALVTLGFVMIIVIEVILLYHSKKSGRKDLDYIIILGAQVRGTKITRSLKRRLDTALYYLKDNPNTIVIASGGQGKNEAISEAEAMMGYLCEHGILKNRILKEERSRNTFENVLYSKALVNPDSSVGIVTNGFHLYRSMRLAKKQELGEVYGIAAPTDKILAVNYYIREAIGVLKDKMVGNI